VAAVSPKRDRGFFFFDRTLVDAYCAKHEVHGEPRWLFVHLLVFADDMTGAVDGDFVAVADDLGLSRWALRRRLVPLEEAGVVLVHSTNAPGKGGLVIVDYATLNPRSRLAKRLEESCDSAPLSEETGEESGAGVVRESCDSSPESLRNRTTVVADPHDSPGETPPRQEDGSTGEDLEDACSNSVLCSAVRATSDGELPSTAEQEEDSLYEDVAALTEMAALATRLHHGHDASNGDGGGGY
jgi:hypothetical protein